MAMNQIYDIMEIQREYSRTLNNENMRNESHLIEGYVTGRKKKALGKKNK